jgi:hypothetical protein
MIRLALDPSQGGQSAWPIVLQDGAPSWNEALIVAILNEWPDAATVDRLTNYVQGGGSLVLFIQPGVEDSWASLDPSRQTALAELLPSAPLPAAATDASYHASILRPNDPVLADIGDPREAEGRLVVTRLVRFAPSDSAVTAIINAAPNDPDSPAKLTGLLWRRALGAGQIYTWATLPDRTCGNLRVWDLFPPAMVNSVGQSAAQEVTLNADLGQPLILPGEGVPAGAEVDLVPPGQEAVKVSRSGDRYVFGDTSVPGLYAWRWADASGQSGSLGWSNVSPSAAEARLLYRPLSEIAGSDATVIAGHSLDEIRQHLADLDEPHPQWSGPIALVLLLLCVESLLGALPKRGLFKRKAAIGNASGGISGAAGGAVHLARPDSR